MSILVGLALSLSATPTRAEIFGDLELPDGFASGASNVQGWAYTDTPGAELVQPFAVLLDGVEEFQVPCCGPRFDVQLAHPAAPPNTGFSVVYNWGLAAVAARPTASSAAPAIVDPPPQVLVQVVLTDTMGGLKILSKSVDLYHLTTWPRSKLAQWQEGGGGILARPEDTSQGGIVVPVDAECFLTNFGPYTPFAATLTCTNLVFTAPDDSTEICPTASFSWDKGTQSFRLVSECFLSVF